MRVRWGREEGAKGAGVGVGQRRAPRRRRLGTRDAGGGGVAACPLPAGQPPPLAEAVPPLRCGGVRWQTAWEQAKLKSIDEVEKGGAGRGGAARRDARRCKNGLRRGGVGGMLPAGMAAAR